MVNNMTHADLDTLVKARRVISEEFSDISLIRGTLYARLLCGTLRYLHRLICYCQSVFEKVDSVESEV